MQTKILDRQARDLARELFRKLLAVRLALLSTSADPYVFPSVIMAEHGLIWHPADGYATFADTDTGYTYSFPWTGDWTDLFVLMFPVKQIKERETDGPTQSS